MDSFNSPTTKPIYKGTQIVWYALGLLEALLAFRFVLKLLGANPGAGFTNAIYSSTYIFAEPFLNVFRITRIQGSVMEWTTLLAMFVYFLAATAVVQLFLMGKTVSTPEAAAALQDQKTT